ncbi:MAG: hypothetical protein DVB26_00885 [Verrucomicrobia bacterium]|nr:MAG: hypothetical protein DVB26_00885 [Verrucomicrobiota bacterium]
MRLQRWMVMMVWLALGWAGRCAAIIFLATGDAQHNTTTPGDNSGWQYEGKFHEFLGVPIAPFFFITAQHIGGSVGDVFDFHGDHFTTIAVHNSPSTDLRIWEVDHAMAFPTYAALSSGAAERVGATVTVCGRGTQRGAEVVVGGEAKGWLWGPGDQVERWGRNTLVNTVSVTGLGELLYCEFNHPGVADECHLSVGDSGGGMFVLEDGLWRLAGIHYGVDGPFRDGASGSPFMAALYDIGGLEVQNPGWMLIPEQTDNIPSSFYSSRIAASLAWIMTIAGIADLSVLAPESYAAWQRLYFTPEQIAAPASCGPAADFDRDGISNLLEFAFNLDPTFNEAVSMQADTGLRGLPIGYVETTDGNARLTLEYVRRTSASAAGLIYTPQFSSNLIDWHSLGTATVTPINPRWERVKVADLLTTSEAPIRFARLSVALAE